MNNLEPFSIRNKPQTDIYQYVFIGPKLKTQFYFIVKDFFTKNGIEYEIENEMYKKVAERLCRLHGVRKLSTYDEKYEQQLERYINSLEKVELVLDAIEIVFQLLEVIVSKFKKTHHTKISYKVKDAEDELNMRFRQNDIGYRYTNGNIIRLDNEVLHVEVTKKALDLLRDQRFENVNEEFLKAQEHYKKGNEKECLNDCLKAFESCMKIICKINTWEFESNHTAKNLIQIIIKNEFLPNYSESSLHALEQLLKSTIPTIRNKNSGHGQGANKIHVSSHLCRYMLYLTGATIVFMIENENSIKK
ncbi:MAG TPA: hypothetical protein VK202_09870 [Bacteroidia bacterium]|nr:hypothetical protein [Bacteroidia bacterium]